MDLDAAVANLRAKMKRAGASEQQIGAALLAAAQLVVQHMVEVSMQRLPFSNLSSVLLPSAAAAVMHCHALTFILTHAEQVQFMSDMPTKQYTPEPALW